MTDIPPQANPFDLVKATDLTDDQIHGYWVDLPGGAGLVSRVAPKSPMPMFILGGKGSGKTHLMRYLSLPLQKRRGYGDELEVVRSDGYLGVYVRCGGLDAFRFAGKGQPDDTWLAVFSYCFEVWLARVALDSICQLVRSGSAKVSEKTLVKGVRSLFDRDKWGGLDSLADMSSALSSLYRQAALIINNASISRKLDGLEILSSPGRLFFGVPRILSETLSAMAGVRFVYLIDELENLTESQQMFVNTLVRERTDPVGIKIGARLYGVRTNKTLNTGEENRKDSEYSEIVLDSELRKLNAEYHSFSKHLIDLRLRQAGYRIGADQMPDFFEEPTETERREGESLLFKKRYSDKERPYFKKLKEKLTEGIRNGFVRGTSSEDIDSIVASLATPHDPFCEKINLLLFYRAWSNDKDLAKEAKAIGEEASRFLSKEKQTEHDRVLEHFKSDIWAQLMMDTKRPQIYLGFDTFVEMSSGLPRCLLTILKHIFTWAVFYGEKPFLEGKISVKSQTRGIQQAEEWFFSEARSGGGDGMAIRDAMTRLGELLREIRFSDKPSECALSTFSVHLAEMTPRAYDVVAKAERWSMLLSASEGQHERNTGRVDAKFRVHPMLAPRWDLPIASRGALSLTGREASVIFDETMSGAFPQLKHKRVRRMTAPTFGKSKKPEESERPAEAEPRQQTIPGIDDD